MGKLIDIHEGKTLRVAEDWNAAVADAAAFRLQIDVQLDELAEGEVVPSVLSPKRLSKHKALVRRLVLAWLRNHPAVVALTASDDEIGAFLFPAKVATGTKLAPKEG